MNNREYTDSEKKCIRTAMNILAYADNTCRRLVIKLRQKGFSSEDADTAVAYCLEKGYIDEARQLEAAVHHLAVHKLYGRRRITAELNKLGFSRTAIAEADYSGIDFAENCYQLWLKRGGILDDRTRQYLAAHGYGSSDISLAQKRIMEQQDEEENDL